MPKAQWRAAAARLPHVGHAAMAARSLPSVPDKVGVFPHRPPAYTLVKYSARAALGYATIAVLL